MYGEGGAAYAKRDGRDISTSSFYDSNQQPVMNRHKEEGLKARLEHVESQIIEEALRESSGNMAKAARRLQLTERIIGLRVKKYNINIHSSKIDASDTNTHLCRFSYRNVIPTLQ